MNTDEKKIKEALRDLPGAAIDAADSEKVNEEEVRERTAVLDENPRNDDDKMPTNPD